MNPTRRRLSLWHFFLFAVVLVGVVVIAGALAERRYALAAVALFVVAIGPPVAARMRRLRSVLSDNDQEHR